MLFALLFVIFSSILSLLWNCDVIGFVMSCCVCDIGYVVTPPKYRSGRLCHLGCYFIIQSTSYRKRPLNETF